MSEKTATPPAPRRTGWRLADMVVFIGSFRLALHGDSGGETSG